MKSESSTPSRRAPMQARAQQRVAEILDAAERLIGSQGYDAITTNHIAAAAGVSIGSIYQFFANKFEILQALTTRYRDGLLGVYANSLPNLAALPPEEIVNFIYDGVMRYNNERAAFSLVVMSAAPGSELAQAAQRIYDAMHFAIDRLMAVRAPWLSAEQRYLYTTISLTSARAIQARRLAELLAGNEAFANQIEQESRTLQTAYFNHLLQKHGPTT